MADGDQFPFIQHTKSDGGFERRSLLRPKQLVSPRSRVSGRLLARAFMGSDAATLALAASGLALALHGYRPEALIGAALAFGLLYCAGAYDLRRQEAARRHLVLAASAVFAGLATPLVLTAGRIPPEVMRIDQIWAAGTVAVLGGLHLGWHRIVAGMRAKGRLTPNVVIVGATPAAERLIRWALGSPGAINVVGVFDDRRRRIGPQIAGVPILGGVSDLVDHRVLPYVDRIIIAVPAKANARISELTALLESVPNPVTLLFDDGETNSGRAALDRIANFGLQQINGVQRSTAEWAVKRIFDLVAASTAVVLLAPLLLVIAAAIRLDSPGPVLFRQKRHGYFNEEFLVFKFRSMRVEASDHQARRQVSANDDRVTRVGRVIRRTSLDELPQLFNVIRGEMSLVGPRPHAIGMLVEGEDAARLVSTYAHRHRIKPGLTGWAAIHGSRGPVDTPADVGRRVALDLEYIERHSIWLDLLIMIRTLPCILGDKTAVR